MAFTLSRESDVLSLGVVYQEFLDPDSGTKHIHVKAPDSENAFMVSFPTVPRSDDGRAHILEHLSLCGSRKYPTRDPFFAMMSRSLATFMNAMTYPDRTVYPFASQDRKDFFNLLDVYLDAAFFPNLDPMDFLQEGWRLEFDAQGKLGYNGVVFNEMKEPIASPSRALWRGMEKALKPGTTYSFESGGDPLAIPQLTHAELVEFHKTHYHPSRAVFWSYGDIDPREIQAQIQSEVISKISTRLPRIEPDSAAPPLAPRKVDIRVPSEGERAEHGFQAGWIIGEIGRDHGKIDDWQIFSRAVTGDAAAPLSMALEGSGFGRPSFAGLSSSERQATFLAGMAGLEEREIPKAREVIFAALERIAREGISHARLEAVLLDFELSSQEIIGGSTPHGLGVLLRMAPAELNGGDPLRELDVRAALEKAKLDIADPDFIPRMARHLLESPERVEARVIPDPDFVPARLRAEEARLKAIRTALTPSEIEHVKRTSATLLERQRTKPNFSCLPRIHPSEISRELPSSLDSQFEPGTPSAPARALVEAPTNGVGYFGLTVDASSLPRKDWIWLDFGADLSMELGFAGLDFEKADLWRSEHGSSFSCSAGAARASAQSGSSMALRLHYGARALERESGAMARAVAQMAQAPRFDERERIAFLIQSELQETIQNISNAAGSLAGSAASAGFGALGSYQQEVGGLTKLRFMEQLDAMSRSEEGLDQIRSKLDSVFSKLASAPATLTYVGSREAALQAFEEAASTLGERAGPAVFDSVQSPIAPAGGPEMGRSALVGPGQLNYCHASWEGPEQGHPDCGPMLVLASLLRNTFLHRALREEGGAYGGGASHNAAMGCFTMSSYRDPRLSETYADFGKAIHAAVEGPIAQDDLEEAVISVMQSLDKPGGPRERGGMALARAFGGVDREMRLGLRRSILEASVDDLHRVARAYLLDKPCRQAAYVCPSSAEDARAIGMEAIPVLPPAATVRPQV